MAAKWKQDSHSRLGPNQTKVGASDGPVSNLTQTRLLFASAPVIRLNILKTVGLSLCVLVVKIHPPDRGVRCTVHPPKIGVPLSPERFGFGTGGRVEEVGIRVGEGAGVVDLVWFGIGAGVEVGVGFG